MKHVFLSIVALLAVSLSACSQANNKNDNTMKQNENKTVLVAYFSATGTTKEAAQQLAKAANADLFEITPEVAYTAADLDWQNKQSRSTVEMEDLKFRPAIKNGKVKNISQYDTVYVGFPIWWYTAPTIVNTWIEANDLKGKTIIVFATSGGSTTQKAVKDMQKTYPDYMFKDGGLLNKRTFEEAKAMVESVK